MKQWTFPIGIVEQGGDFVVTVRDLPEVITSGSTMDEAVRLAADAVEVALAGRMEDDMEVPFPSSAMRGERPVSLNARLAAKASVYSAWKAARLSKVELAKRLNRNEAEVRRILDPRYGTKLDQMEEAAKALGGRLSVSFEAV